ncbi:MAG: Rieske 2Fe-2S domain-containing protein [Alphaproteobacteria bacterium]
MRDAVDNPARPVAGTVLCMVDDIKDPGAKGFRFRKDQALFAGFLVRQGEAVVGYVDSCPHNGWPLAVFDDLYLTRTGDRILCAAHGAVFRPDDGVCVGGPCAGERLTPWAIEVVGSEVRTS